MSKALLERAGFEVAAARDGRDAIHILLASPSLPAAVVLDMRMPGMDGQEVLRVLRSYSRLAQLPIVLHSAYPPDWDALRLAQAFVRKQDTQSRLVPAVRACARGTVPPIAE